MSAAATEKRKPPPQRPKLKAKLEAALAECAELRERIGLATPTVYETWAKNIPQHFRDEMAVRALFAEWMDEFRALRRLGFTVRMVKHGGIEALAPEMWDLSKAVFGTEGVQQLLARNTATEEDERIKIVQRLKQISMHGSDDSAVRASQQLAKLCGWNKGMDSLVGPGGTVNIFQQMASAASLGDGGMKRVGQSSTNDPDATIDAADFLSHEPGEATLVVDVDDK